MIKFSFTLSNTLVKQKFKNLFNWHKKISTFKVFEVEFIYYNRNLIFIEGDLTWSGYDHAGPEIEIGALGYSVHLRIYDVRHWDPISSTWQKHGGNR